MNSFNFGTNFEKRMPNGQVYFVDRMTSDYANNHPFDVDAFLEGVFQKWNTCETAAFRETREAIRSTWENVLNMPVGGNAELYPNKNGAHRPALVEVWLMAGDYWRCGFRLGDVLPAVLPGCRITRLNNGEWIALFPKDLYLLHKDNNLQNNAASPAMPTATPAATAAVTEEVAAVPEVSPEGTTEGTTEGTPAASVPAAAEAPKAAAPSPTPQPARKPRQRKARAAQQPASSPVSGCTTAATDEDTHAVADDQPNDILATLRSIFVELLVTTVCTLIFWFSLSHASLLGAAIAIGMLAAASRMGLTPIMTAAALEG